MKSLKSGLLAGICVAGFCHPAFAQTAESPSDQPVAGEIIVTAQKRSENVQDVPKAVDVVSAQELKAAGVSSIQDLSRVSVSVQGPSSGPFGPPAIRGVSTFGFSIGVQAQTGIVLDDVPQPSFSTLANELTDIERVEVLPGPQSTLSGRNAAGGLINIVTHNPTATFKASGSIEATDDHQVRLGGYLSGPIAPQLSFSVSGYYNKWDGLLKNAQLNNRRLGGFDLWGVRGKLLFEPADNVRLQLTGYYTHGKFETPAIIGGNPFISATANAGFAFAPVPFAQLYPGVTPAPYNMTISSSSNGISRNKNRGLTFRADVDTGIGTISSITNYSHGNQPRDDRFLAFPLGGEIRAQTDTDVKYTSQELRLASADKDSKLQYTLGAIYTDTKNFEPYKRNILFPVDWDRTASLKSFAAYGRVTYEFLPQTRITGGMRFQNDKQSYRWVFVDGTSPTSTGSSSGSFVTGEASLQHNFSDDVMGYLTYANAQSGPAYDLEDDRSARSAAGLTPIASQKVQSYEAGLKTQFWDRKVTFNISAFSATYKNYQVQSLQNPCATCVPVIRLFAVGKVRTQGIEIQTAVRPVEGFQFGLAASILDPKILDYPGANCFPGQTAAQGCVAGVQNRKGVLPGTAKFSMQGTLDYTIQLPSASFDPKIGIAYRYTGALGYDLLGDPLAVQEAVGIWNANIGLKSHSGNWGVEFFVNNVFNRRYYASVANAPLQPPGAVATIATYARDAQRYGGLRLNFNF